MKRKIELNRISNSKLQTLRDSIKLLKKKVLTKRKENNCKTMKGNDKLKKIFKQSDKRSTIKHEQ